MVHCVIDILFFHSILTLVSWRWRLGAFHAHYYLKEAIHMVNPTTVKFVLDLIIAVATAAAGVVVKYYADVPQS